MRISKFLPMICAMAVCANFVRAQDNPEQAAARAALVEKMNELNAQTNSAPPIVVTPSGNVVVEQPAAPAPTNPPAVAAPPAETQPAAAPATSATTSSTPSDTEAQAEARAALMEKMSESNAPPVETPTPTPTPTPPSAPAPVVETPAPAPTIAPATNAVVVEKPAQPAAPVAAEPSPPASVNYPGKELGFKPIEVPPLPISADKEARLEALNAKYIANQISPQEYFKQREAIIHGP